MKHIQSLPKSRALPWALFVIALASAVFFALQWRSESAIMADAAEVEDEASEFVIALTNFSSKSIEADVADIRRFATGQFEKEVDELFSEDVVNAIAKAGAASEAEIESVFVQSIGEDNASVFAVLTETVTNENLETPRTDTVRMEVGMIETDGGWKVDSVQLFQSPGAGLVPSG